MIIPPYQPRVTTWQDLPEAADPETAQGDQVLRAADVNGWQAQLSLVSDAVNSHHYGLAGLTGSVSVLTEQQPKGTMLAHDGTAWTGQTGGHGQVLTPDTSSPTGASWLRPVPHATAAGAVESVTPTITHPVTPTGTPIIGQGNGPLRLFAALDGGVYSEGTLSWLFFSAQYYLPVGGGTIVLGILPPSVRPYTPLPISGSLPYVQNGSTGALPMYAERGSSRSHTGFPGEQVGTGRFMLNPFRNAGGLLITYYNGEGYSPPAVSSAIGVDGKINMVYDNANAGTHRISAEIFAIAGKPLWRWKP